MNKENATRYVSDMVSEAYGHIHMLRRIANDTDTIQAQQEAVQGLTWFAELVDCHRRLEQFGDDNDANTRHNNGLSYLAAFYRSLSLVTGQYADAMRYKALSDGS